MDDIMSLGTQQHQVVRGIPQPPSLSKISRANPDSALLAALSRSLHWCASLFAEQLRLPEPIRETALDGNTPQSLAHTDPSTLDIAQMRNALAELGRQRLDRTITEAEFIRERARIFDPLYRAPILSTAGRVRSYAASRHQATGS